MPKWKFLAHGTKANQLILAKHTSGGLIEKVAAAYPSRQGYVYKLYPVSYKGFKTITQHIKVSVHDIDLKGA